MDNFTFPLCNPLNKFNSSNSLTLQGHYKVGNLTLRYGNLTTDPTILSSMENPSPSTSTTHTNNANQTTSPYDCNSVECPTSSTSTKNCYGSTTTNPTPCNSVEHPTSSTSTQTHYGNLTTAPRSCVSTLTHQGASSTSTRTLYGNLTTAPMSSVSTLTHQGTYRNFKNFRVTNFRALNFRCNLLFAVSRWRQKKKPRK